MKSEWRVTEEMGAKKERQKRRSFGTCEPF